MICLLVIQLLGYVLSLFNIPFQQCPSLEKVILPAYCDLEVFWPELGHGLGRVEEISFNPQNEENLTLFNMKHVTGPIFL